ncbi:hypothetical protein [Micropruina sp.]|uniref:hypothetical protein n=1 Tax=Micropruina sp. TaxID=2737536 RepID=UPI0039E42EF7
MKRMRCWLAALVAGLLALAGCSTPAGTVAATVNGTVISSAQLDAVTTAVGRADAAKADLNEAVLTMAIRGELARVIAKEQAIEITRQGQVEALAANTQISAYAKFLDDPDAASFAEDAADLSLVLTKVGAEAFVARAQQITVQVNPRYGAWSVDSLAVDQTAGQLSEPWVSPSAPA